MTGQGRRPGRRAVLSIALAAVAVGVALVAYALVHQESAPAPPRSVGRIEPTQTAAGTGPAEPQQASTEASGHASPSGNAAPKPLGPSKPVHLRIPAIGVDTPVNPIGLNPDGTLAVPQPGPHLNQAAWFENSPTPGQPGPSIIEGHVDSVEGVSVFFKLGDIRPGNRIHVRRADGLRLTFRVDAVRDYKKAHFPTMTVYGSSGSGRPELRLITCSDFVESIHHHVGNEVVFAHLTHHSGAHEHG